MSDPARQQRLAAEAAGAARPPARPPVTVPDNSGPFSPAQLALVQQIAADAATKAVANYAAKHPATVTTAPPVVAPPVAPPPVVVPPKPPVVTVPVLPVVPTKPTTRFIPIYRQNKDAAVRCVSLGCTVVFGYEPEADPVTKAATVTMAQWKAAFAAAGMRYVCEPSSDLIADAADPHFAGWLFPIDEPDAKILDAVERGDAAGAEAVYAAAEAFGASCSAASNADRWVNLDGNQLRYHSHDGKIDYPRLLKPFTKVSQDYYPVQRAEPMSVLSDVLDIFVAVAGSKAAAAFIDCSDQNLDARWYKSREPTPDEVKAEADLVRARSLAVGYFPQRLPQNPPPDGNGIGFAWNNMTPSIEQVVRSINAAL